MMAGGAIVATPQILPITDMRYRHMEVMAKLAKGPVFLTRHGIGEAVLLSTEQWDKLMAYLDERTDIIDVLEAELELARNEDSIKDIDTNELEAIARGEHLPT
jgi:PHD/YefM family antitoxin component YafN of YafNO toxin-antitoxin module